MFIECIDAILVPGHEMVGHYSVHAVGGISVVKRHRSCVFEIKQPSRTRDGSDVFRLTGYNIDLLVLANNCIEDPTRPMAGFIVFAIGVFEAILGFPSFRVGGDIPLLERKVHVYYNFLPDIYLGAKVE